MQIVPVADHHLPAIVELNNAAVPAVNELTHDEMAVLVQQAAWPLVALDPHDDAVLGFMLTLLPGTSYGSLNYAWFHRNYDDFAYMDRIVVDPARRSGGVGAALYAELERLIVAHPERRVPLIGIDVNLRPPNEGSMRFHQRLGFVEVGRQDTEGGAKTVALLAKQL